MDDFEVFDGYHSRVTREMSVSIRQDGNLALNKAALKALRNPESVQFLYNRSKEQIGIRVAPSGDVGTVVRRQKNCSNYVIAGKAFLKEYNIDFSVTRRFDAILRDEMLIIDLNGPSAIVVGPRQGKKRSEKVSESL